MSNRQKIIKTGFFAASAILVLIVATVAWFLVGANIATVEQINADVNTSGFFSVLYESPDLNKNGIHDNDIDEPWNTITAANINISNIVPGEYHFYKAVITKGSISNLQFKFSGISLTLADIEATDADVLGRINVRFRTRDDANQSMTGNDMNESMLDLLGDPPSPDALIYNMSLSGYLGETFTIYYDVGIYKETTKDEKIQGSIVSISTIEFITDN